VHLVTLSCAIGLAAAIPLAVARVSRNPLATGRGVLTRGSSAVHPCSCSCCSSTMGGAVRVDAGPVGGRQPLLAAVSRAILLRLARLRAHTCAYTTEIVAGSMRNVPHGEIEAAKAVGMSRFVMLRRICCLGAAPRDPRLQQRGHPDAAGSSIASAITLVDLTGAARNVYSKHFAPFEAFVFAGPHLHGRSPSRWSPCSSSRTALAGPPAAQRVESTAS